MHAPLTLIPQSAKDNLEFRTFRDLNDLETLRSIWKSWPGARESDFDLFSSTLRSGAQPYVVLLSRNAIPESILIGRRERKRMPFRLGYLTVCQREVEVIEFVYGGLRGNASDKNCADPSAGSDALDGRRRSRPCRVGAPRSEVIPAPAGDWVTGCSSARSLSLSKASLAYEVPQRPGRIPDEFGQESALQVTPQVQKGPQALSWEGPGQVLPIACRDRYGRVRHGASGQQDCETAIGVRFFRHCPGS